MTKTHSQSTKKTNSLSTSESSSFYSEKVDCFSMNSAISNKMTGLAHSIKIDNKLSILIKNKVLSHIYLL